MKTRARRGNGREPAAASARKSPRRRRAPYNSIENIAEFFASRGKKFSVPKTRRWKSRLASADSAPGREFAIRNMAKERSISAKEKAKKPRLRYNFLASD